MRVLFLEADPLYDDLLPAGLRRVGCDVRMLPEVLNGEIDRLVGEFMPDFALTLGWSWFPTEERLAVIRAALDRHGIPLVYWSTEDPVWHEKYCVPYVQAVRPDVVATICTEYVERYEALGFRAVCLPFGYNPEVYQPVPPRPEYACDVAVVANFYTIDFHKLNRKRSLEQVLLPVLRQGYDVKIWGAHWERAPEFGIHLPEGVWQKWLPHRAAAAVYSSAKIVIGLQNEFDFATNLTMRTCEILGSGGFLLTSRTRAMEKFFKHKQHVVMSSSPEETRELVDYYLAHPEERAQIAAAGEEWVSSQHTYGHRALELLEWLMCPGVERQKPVQAAVVRLPYGPYLPHAPGSPSSLPPEESSGSSPGLPPEESSGSSPSLPPEESSGSSPSLPPEESSDSSPSLPPEESSDSSSSLPPEESSSSSSSCSCDDSSSSSSSCSCDDSSSSSSSCSCDDSSSSSSSCSCDDSSSSSSSCSCDDSSSSSSSCSYDDSSSSSSSSSRPRKRPATRSSRSPYRWLDHCTCDCDDSCGCFWEESDS